MSCGHGAYWQVISQTQQLQLPQLLLLLLTAVAPSRLILHWSTDHRVALEILFMSGVEIGFDCEYLSK